MSLKNMQKYMEKVAQDTGNCKLEFNYAYKNRTELCMLPVVMEESMTDTAAWTGVLGLVLGNYVYCKLTSDVDVDFDVVVDIDVYVDIIVGTARAVDVDRIVALVALPRVVVAFAVAGVAHTARVVIALAPYMVDSVDRVALRRRGRIERREGRMNG